MMKNTARKILCALLAMALLFCFWGCGNGKENTEEESPVIKKNATGKYELVKIEWDNGTVSEDEILEDSEDAMGEMYVKLYSDGTATLALFGQVMDMEFSEDEMWQTDNERNSFDFSVRNGKVILEADDTTYTFEKD